MLKVILVDDEILSLDALEHVLYKNEEIEVAGKYTDPLKALESIKKVRPALVFLDIEMPGTDGFSIAREIINMRIDTHIIFATAFEQYALKAFEIDAVDYIVKPFSEKRVRLTVNRVVERLKSSQTNKLLAKTFVKNSLPAQGINKIAVWRENNIVLLDPEAILYFTINSKRVILHTKDDTYESSSSLSELEDKLKGKGFFRCHKSFIINTHYIDKIIPWFNSTYIIKLKESAEEIPVSRYYTKKLKGMLGI